MYEELICSDGWISAHFLVSHLQIIKGKNTIIVSSLTDEKSHDMGHIMTDLELLSYDDVRRNLALCILPKQIVNQGSCYCHKGPWREDYSHSHHCRVIEEEMLLLRSSRLCHRDAFVFGRTQ